ncbi:hypothetical protein Tco_0564564 [Tanacetum coccineum]
MDHEHEVLNLDSAGTSSVTLTSGSVRTVLQYDYCTCDQIYRTYLFSLLERLKADNTNLTSHLPRACLMMAQAGFPFITVNTKEYHSECSGNYHKDNA